MDLLLTMGRDLSVETNMAVKKLLDCGVEHGDIWPPNVLWNSESKSMLLVDFERSKILKQVQVLQEVSPNRKRKMLHLDKGIPCNEDFSRAIVGIATCT
jgi:predicted Ser/Thr protein kinase